MISKKLSYQNSLKTNNSQNKKIERFFDSKSSIPTLNSVNKQSTINKSQDTRNLIKFTENTVSFNISPNKNP